MDLNQPIHNIEYLCRICLQEFPDIDDHFISFDTILEEPENISYLQAFQSLTGFLVKNNEPQKICLQCKSKVEFAFDFNKLAVETQQILEKNLIKIEVTEVKAEIDLDVKSPEIEDFSDDDNKDEKAEKEAPIKKSYECEYCNKILQHYSGLVTHLKVLHPKMKKICEFCSKEYYLQVQLDKHLNACKKNPNRKKYDSQMNHAKYRQKIICPICGMLAEKNHMKIHEKHTKQDETINQKPFICDLCGKTYQNRIVLTNHLKYLHLGHKLKCKDCDAYLTQNELPKHQRRMHKYVQRTFRCRKCPFTTMKEQDLRNHRQTHKVPRIYKCHICGSDKFKTSVKLTIHMASHSDARPHACETCGATFKTRRAVTIHYKTHKPHDYECPVCEKSYLTNQLMRHHVKKNHPEYQLPPLGTVVSKSWRLKQAEHRMKEMAVKQGMKPEDVSVTEVPSIEEFPLYQPYYKL